MFNRWPTFDEDPIISNYEDNGNHAKNQESGQDLEYQPYDDNTYNNVISDREYPWEEIGQFGTDHLSTSGEVNRETIVRILSHLLAFCLAAFILFVK